MTVRDVRALLPSRRADMLRTVGLDIIAPLIVYRLLRGAGMSTVWSLVLSGLPPGLGVAIDWRRTRSLDAVAVVVLSGIALNVVMALVTSDPKWVLLDGAATTGVFGLACALSLRWRRPLIFRFAQSFYGGAHTDAGRELDFEYDKYDRARWYWRVVTAVWGGTHLFEAAALAAVVQTAGTGTALAFNRIAPWLITAALFAWMFGWAARLRRLRAAAEAAEAAGPDGAPAALPVRGSEA
jgi:hypothetical protein